MQQPIIEVNNIGKKYNIIHQRGGYVALRDVLMNVLKSPFSFLKTKAKQVAGLETKEDFWALKDINFSIKKGEVVGIIGGNGAGKSTLLKILSQITPPTTGEIKVRGRVGSLLEVGTGFHPELTGRENIFLNGAILGMKQKEIAEKFDAIVVFSGVEKFLDTPVKHYSSGMYVRLAFSVAAHMDPDILIIDEVLAVGDAEFQKKCLGKMEEITASEGRTILFVSHNLAAIQQLCNKTIVLQNGKIAFEGPTEDAIAFYADAQNNQSTVDVKKIINRKGNGLVKLTGFYMEDAEGTQTRFLKTGSPAHFVFSYECTEPEKVSDIDFGLSIGRDMNLVSVVYSSYTKTIFSRIQPTGTVRFKVENLALAPGTYTIGVRILADNIEADYPRGPIASFDVLPSEDYAEKGYRIDARSTVFIDGTWS
jgi:lipopolysaccharide transport system ATP-binding protein